MVKKLTIFFIVLIFCQCMTWEPLRIKKEDNLTGKLRLDGYYYIFSPDFNVNEVIFLYSNGVIYQLNDSWSDLNIIEGRLAQNFYIQNGANQDNPAHWGSYTIKRDSIYTDRWTSGGGTGDKPREYGVGRILNDTTFTNSAFGGRGPFRFRHFPIKPDSTNRFVK